MKCNISTLAAGEEVRWADVSEWNSCSETLQPFSCRAAAEGSRALAIQSWPNIVKDELFAPFAAVWFTPPFFFSFFFCFYPAGFSFQPDPKEERRIFFLTSHLPFAWLHKCASVPLLMTCSITDKHLLICPPGKWAGRLLTPLRLILQLLEYCWTTHMNVQEEWQDCGLHMDTQLLFTSGICQISMLEKPA